MLTKRVVQGVFISLLIGGCSVKDMRSNGSEKPVVLFILDTSQSMRDIKDKKSKISNAKASILKTVKKMNKDKFNTALITFDNTRRCRAKAKVALGSPTNILNTIETIDAWGMSPLADAIALSTKMLNNTEKKMVVLLSDGKDNCGGDPVAEAKKLYNKYGIKVNLQVIGYALEKKKQEELKKIALISRDWMYHDAKDGTAVKKIIEKIMPPKQKKRVLPKIEKVVSMKIEPMIVNPIILESSVVIEEQPIVIESNIDAKIEIEHFVFKFDTASNSLKDDFTSRAEVLNSYIENNDKRILIIGHADSRGTENFNQQLSIKRAKSVRNKLILLGIDANKIQIAGRGESMPIASNDTKEGQRENRRVEIKILD